MGDAAKKPVPIMGLWIPSSRVHGIRAAAIPPSTSSILDYLSADELESRRRTQAALTMRAGKELDHKSRAFSTAHGLTPAESDVVAALAHGQNLAAIAEARGVSVSTVRSQLKAIFRKTGTSSQVELLAWVFRQGG
jgi:DNA-binding CsgD family transcriptional regulator